MVAVPIVLYGVETQIMAVAKKKRLNVMMKCLRSVCGVTLMNQERNEEVRRRTDVTRIGWSSRAVCVEVVWTHGVDGGRPVGKENNMIR